MIWYLPPPCLLSATFLAILLRFRSKSCIKPPILAVAAPPKSSNFLIKNLALTSFGDKKQILRKFCNSFLYKKAKLGKKFSLNEKLEPISCTTELYYRRTFKLYNNWFKYTYQPCIHRDMIQSSGFVGHFNHLYTFLYYKKVV